MSEKRIDPDDGSAYTYEELVKFYTGKFKKKQIDQYWEHTCYPAKAKAKKKGKPAAAKEEPEEEGAKESKPAPKRSVDKRRTLTFRHIFTARNPGRIDDYYDIDKKLLGEGAFGSVVRGKDKSTQATRAIKAIDASKIQDRKLFEREISMQQQLDHAHIVRLYEIFKDAKRIYLVMELCTGGELFDRIQEEEWFDEKRAATYMQQIMGAMNYLHHSSIVHRDIKPENFLLQNTDEDAPIKVIDFGLSKVYKMGSGPTMRTKVGTVYYMSPQVIEGAYDEKCDVWSCGSIAYILLCGSPPFTGNTDPEIIRNVKAGKYEFPDDEFELTEAAKDVIKLMLTIDAAKRPSAADVLKHPWFTENAEKPSGAVGKDLGGRMRSFRTASKFKRVALTVVAQRLPDEDVEDLKRTFVLLDEEQNGVLSALEVRRGMEKHGVEIPADLEDLMRSCDSDGSGNIDYTEFLAATLSAKQYMKREVMWAAFRAFDKDGDGVITNAELALLLEEDEDSDVVAAMMKEADADGDGKVSFDEFVAMMEKDAVADKMVRRRTSASLDPVLIAAAAAAVSAQEDEES